MTSRLSHNDSTSRVDVDSQIDMTATEDATMITLAQQLDEHTSMLRQSVLDAVLKMRGKMSNQAKAMIDGERSRTIETERQLLQQVEGLQHLLKERMGDLETERALSERLVVTMQRQARRRRTQALAKEGLRRWHEYACEARRRERMCKHLIEVRRERQARQAFSAWRFEVLTAKHRQQLEDQDGKHRRSTARLESEHQTAQNAMKLEMMAITEKLSDEERRRAILEERLKAAFMRGVCALNMEALQVLRSAPNAEGNDVSVASLLQAMNLTSTTDSQQAEPASTDRLLRQQEALASQLAQFQSQFEAEYANANAGSLVSAAHHGGAAPTIARHADPTASAREAAATHARQAASTVRVTMHSRSPNVAAPAPRASSSKPKIPMASARKDWRSY